ncbi:MAG: hypothetical protein JXA66_06985, partial [Oligoflexia bacterium]|nr:hypothetical protein [Oligoflexia bacterium]
MNKSLSTILLTILVTICCSCGGSVPETEIVYGDPVDVTTGTIGSTGGTISVNSGPLNGLEITFPANAVSADTQIKVQYANIDAGASSLPEETSPVSKMLILTATPDTQFGKPVSITLPYNTGETVENEFVNAYHYQEIERNGKTKKRMEATAITGRDTSGGKVSFIVRHFSMYLILEWVKKVKDILATSADFDFDTGFSVKNDGWFIPNYGSILNPGGNCIGMSSYSKWYFTWGDLLDGASDLYEKYRDGDKDDWRDDSCAIELASRMQSGESAIWNRSYNDMVSVGISSLEVAKSFVQAMRDTG